MQTVISKTPPTPPRFVRRTTLKPDEYRKNFRQIDQDVIEALTSEAACRVTPLISKIYLRLISAPSTCWEREGVLRFNGCEQEGNWLTAWEQLLLILNVASATARKSLQWMHREGIIGYDAHRNGVGIRIFMNRAASSIAQGRPDRQKNLCPSPTSSHARHTSRREAPFKDSFAVLESLDTDINPRAPKNGAAEFNSPVQTSFASFGTTQRASKTSLMVEAAEATSTSFRQPPRVSASDEGTNGFSLEAVVSRCKAEFASLVTQAAAQAAAREHEQTRAWLDKYGIPKATRVAQREAFNVLRQHGLVRDARRTEHASANEFSAHEGDAACEVAKPLGAREIDEWAEVCIGMLECQGQSIATTLENLSVGAGGFLLPDDAHQVRLAAESKLCARKDHIKQSRGT